LLQDVYRGLEGHVSPGEVKRIAVVEEGFKPESTFDSRRILFAHQKSAISAGATYTPKRLLGYARVEDDGSAHFRVPAGRALYFLALDAEGRAVQRMRTFTHFKPGEIQGCIGCHEPRTQTSANGRHSVRLAMRRPAVALTPPSWGSTISFGFREHVQPVLDRHCLGCHDGKKASPVLNAEPGRVLHKGGKRTAFSNGYVGLLGPKPTPDIAVGSKPLNAWLCTNNGDEWNIRRITPKLWGAPNSRLADLVLSGHPCKNGKPRISLNPDERSRIITWIDLNCPFYAGYDKEATKGLCVSSCTTQPGKGK
jgi:hypothetical protein